jgi:hypothetical protein
VGDVSPKHHIAARQFCPLFVVVNLRFGFPTTHQIIAKLLTDNDVHDSQVVKTMLDETDHEIKLLKTSFFIHRFF